jgi:hypothetical protein
VNLKRESAGVPTSNTRLEMRFDLETLGTCYLNLQGTSTSAAADFPFDRR